MKNAVAQSVHPDMPTRSRCDKNTDVSRSLRTRRTFCCRTLMRGAAGSGASRRTQESSAVSIPRSTAVRGFRPPGPGRPDRHTQHDRRPERQVDHTHATPLGARRPAMSSRRRGAARRCRRPLMTNPAAAVQPPTRRSESASAERDCTVSTRKTNPGRAPRSTGGAAAMEEREHRRHAGTITNRTRGMASAARCCNPRGSVTMARMMFCTKHRLLADRLLDQPSLRRIERLEDHPTSRGPWPGPSATPSACRRRRRRRRSREVRVGHGSGDQEVRQAAGKIHAHRRDELRPLPFENGPRQRARRIARAGAVCAPACVPTPDELPVGVAPTSSASVGRGGTSRCPHSAQNPPRQFSAAIEAGCQ
jgi:hypothetical protein